MRLIQAVLALLLTLPGSSLAGPLSPSERAELQAAMAGHINRNMVNQRYITVDRKSGDVRSLTPLEPHPLIFTLGDYFVLCTDFNDEHGRRLNIDFFVAKSARGYTVFETMVERRDLFRAMISRGQAKKAE